MHSRFTVTVAILLWAPAAAAHAQSVGQMSFAPFAVGEKTIQSQMPQIPGCECGIGQDQTDPRLKRVQVSPESVRAKVGEQVDIRFDATRICQGQTVRSVSGIESGKPSFAAGTIQWEELAQTQLPDGYGHALYSGYTQAGDYTVRIKIDVQCFDIGAKCKEPSHYKTCHTEAEVPVVVR
jgi:hypothetical protein